MVEIGTYNLCCRLFSNYDLLFFIFYCAQTIQKLRERVLCIIGVNSGQDDERDCVYSQVGFCHFCFQFLISMFVLCQYAYTFPTHSCMYLLVMFFFFFHLKFLLSYLLSELTVACTLHRAHWKISMCVVMWLFCSLSSMFPCLYIIANHNVQFITFI